MANMQPRPYLQPGIFDAFPELITAQSTRLGGSSPSPYESQNLGLYTKDGPEAIQKNRCEFFSTLGFKEAQTAGMHQVHGDQVFIVEKGGQYEGYDALITQQTNVLLTVTTADCTPILLYAPQQQVCAAIHAGWRGTVAQIAQKTLQDMQAYFAIRPADCYAYIGPCIDECSFEVDADVAGHFAGRFKRWDEDKGKFFIDLKAANRDQLLTAGLSPKNIEVSPYSTYTNNDLFFSYRKEGGRTGRMLTVIGRRE